LMKTSSQPPPKFWFERTPCNSSAVFDFCSNRLRELAEQCRTGGVSPPGTLMMQKDLASDESLSPNKGVSSAVTLGPPINVLQQPSVGMARSKQSSGHLDEGQRPVYRTVLDDASQACSACGETFKRHSELLIHWLAAHSGRGANGGDNSMLPAAPSGFF
jgi:hypothetical protein